MWCCEAVQQKCRYWSVISAPSLNRMKLYLVNKEGRKEGTSHQPSPSSIGGTGGGCLAMNIEMFLNICSPPNAWPVSWQVHWSVTAEYPLVCGLMLKMSLPWKFHDHFSFFAKTHCLEHADFKKLCHQFFLAMVTSSIRKLDLTSLLSVTNFRIKATEKCIFHLCSLNHRNKYSVIKNSNFQLSSKQANE